MVQMSCVIGVPDPYRMQKVKAFVKLAPEVPASDATKQALLSYCAKHIAKYAMPYDIEFREDMPKTLVGKVAYRVLEEEEQAKLAAQSGEGLVDPGEVTTSAPTETPAASDGATAPAGETTAPAGETTGQATQNADRPSDETRNGFPWTIVIICAAVLALAVVVFLIAKRKPDNK